MEITSLLDTENNLVVVKSECLYCDAEILLAFSPHHVTTEKFIKYMCGKCLFETLIPLEAVMANAS